MQASGVECLKQILDRVCAEHHLDGEEMKTKGVFAAEVQQEVSCFAESHGRCGRVEVTGFSGA